MTVTIRELNIEKALLVVLAVAALSDGWSGIDSKTIGQRIANEMKAKGKKGKKGQKST